MEEAVVVVTLRTKELAPRDIMSKVVAEPPF